MEHVPARVSERQDHIGLSKDTGPNKFIILMDALRVHAQLDQGHGASKGALMICFILRFIFISIFILPAHFWLTCVKEESSQLNLFWVWCLFHRLLTECI